MQHKYKVLSSVITAAVLISFAGCSASSTGDDYVVVKKKEAPKEQYSSISGIEKKSLINQSSLETLTNIVSEYKSTNVDRDAVMTKIIELINTPYLWGGTTTNGIDCSAFVQTVFRKALGIELPRTSIMQSIFFNTMGRRISHVGIYLGESYFAHSSSSGGVKVSSLNEDYYNRKFVTARRVIN